MARPSIFQRLELNAFKAGITPRTKESREWFMKKASKLYGLNRERIMEAEELKRTAKQTIGSMQMFFYDPKHKDKLPYYDLFPLAIIIGPAPGGFYGLNLHYLPPILRAQFLGNLMDIMGDKALSQNAKFDLTYSMLRSTSKLKYYRPCWKHYLGKHVKSKFAEVKTPEWEIATFLPTAQFRKAHRQKVYYDSRQKIAG